MGDEEANEDFPNRDQRFAFCNSQWERREKMEKVATKKYQFKDINLGEQGTFRAVFATLNVVDHDGDMTIPGAFGKQDVIISQYNHGSWGNGMNALPIGVGKIFEEGEDAVVEGEFNMENEAAKATYQTIRYLHEKDRTQEWSYALPEIDYEMRDVDGREVRVLKKIRVPEVSPVLMGAGIGTRLLDIKQKETKRAFGTHKTETSDRSWNGPAANRNTRRDEPRSYYAKIYAWYDPDGDVGNKSTYKFPHHFVSSNGEPGQASTRAASAGIAVLNGARGGANIPESDRRGVWRHLAAHLRDADMEPPELRSMDSNPRSLKLSDHFDMIITEATDLLSRLNAILEKGDRTFNESEAAVNRIKQQVGLIRELAKGFNGLIERNRESVDLEAEVVRFETLKARRRKL
jgi:hypothetical protein